MAEFIHLHNHSHYSLLDGAASIDTIIRTAAEQKMPAVALTDHGVMFGAFEFYKKAKKAGIKPIIGCEAYIVTKGSRKDRQQIDSGRTAKRRGVYNHILLLAKDEQGYRNLVKLTTIAHLEGFYYKPRIDAELLHQYRAGLVATSACPGGVVSPWLISGDMEEARTYAGIYKEIFGDDFYIELQDHGMPDDAVVMREAPAFAKMMGLKTVVTNDCHYIRGEHALYHNIMLHIPDARNTGGALDYTTLRYGSDQLYFKTAAEMARLFKDYPEALRSTLEIAEKCNVVIPKERKMPTFTIPEDAGVSTLDDLLEKMSWDGARKSYGELTPEITQRLEFELGVIKRMKYAGYFLIVQDFINKAKDMGVRVGPGRGSAAGSIVSYVLRITDIEPLRFDLLFERFLNPDRVSMPDIDVDFADDKREQVIEYVRQKYGAECVAQIVTFGTLSSRAVLKDVGRVLGIPHTQVDAITKNIPVEQGKPRPLADALETIPELKGLKSNPDEKVRLMVETALVLEGMNRNVSTHAAGIVIAPGEISNYVPIYASPNSEVMTQYNMKDLEEAGLLKIDFLGLRTLTVIEDALQMIKENHGIDLNLANIPEKDQKTLDLFCRGNTVAVFQFESSGMQDYLRKLKPTCLDDLVAMNALYRPGPMQMIDDFIARKHGKQQIEYLHAKLEPVLKDTYGVIVYQEQVMRIASDVAGFSLAAADLMRRAMGKKDKDAMAKMKEDFVAGASKNGVEKKTAAEIFDLIDKFASYGFNKSHSVAYSFLAYQTAYLKAHYPAEYMAATLTSEMGDTDKIVHFIDDCRKMGIEVLPPDILESGVSFSVRSGAIRFGMSAIKGVGIPAVEQIVKSRTENGPFTDFFDFCSRVDLRLVNKRTMECLVQAGAFDSLHMNRAQLFNSIERGLQYGQSVQSAASRGQSSLFESGAAKIETRPTLPPVEMWKETEKLSNEKSVLGFFISGHPLRRFELDIQSFANVKLGEYASVVHESPVRACGIITGVKKILDRKGKTMAFVSLEDFSGKAECIVFSDPFIKYADLLIPDELVFVEGKADTRGDVLKILVNSVSLLPALRQKQTREVRLMFQRNLMTENSIYDLRAILAQYEGKCECNISVTDGNSGDILLYLETKFRVNPSDDFIDKVKRVQGYATMYFLQ